AGMAATWGAHAALSVCPVGEVISLPDDVDARVAAGLVLAQVGYNGASRPGRLDNGSLVVVVGDGLVGQYAAQVSRARGAQVLLAGRDDHRLTMARRYSADQVVDVRSQDLGKSVRSICPNGARVVIDTAGTAAAVRQATEVVDRDGDVVLLGWYPEGENLVDIFWFVTGRELTAHFTGGWNHERLVATLQCIRDGTIHVAELITHEIEWRDAPSAYAMMLSKSAPFLGLVINWKGAI
ncbi:MAG: zinc-binding dehydrogenase, partial [Chloroflexota bacterium]